MNFTATVTNQSFLSATQEKDQRPPCRLPGWFHNFWSPENRSLFSFQVSNCVKFKAPIPASNIFLAWEVGGTQLLLFMVSKEFVYPVNKINNQDSVGHSPRHHPYRKPGPRQNSVSAIALCLSVSVARVRCHAENQGGEERVLFGLYSHVVGQVLKQGQNLEAGADTKAMEKHLRTCSACFLFYTTRTTSPGVCPHLLWAITFPINH